MPPTFAKTPAKLVAAFEAARPGGAELRKMFGYPALFAGGNMFAATFGPNVVVRLPEAQRAKALKDGCAAFEPMPGRPMREYVVIPAKEAADPAALRRWVRRGAAYAASLPPKRPTAARQRD